MTNFYRNKTCLITGATGGLGKELVGFLVNNHSCDLLKKNYKPLETSGVRLLLMA